MKLAWIFIATGGLITLFWYLFGKIGGKVLSEIPTDHSTIAVNNPPITVNDQPKIVLPPTGSGTVKVTSGGGALGSIATGVQGAVAGALGI